LVLSEENEFPHSAYRVWQIHTNKALEKTLPGLKAAQKGEFIIVAMLIAAGTIVGLFGAIFVYETYVSPPLQVFGICPPPAQLTGAGCTQTTTTVVNGQTQTVQVPGNYYYEYLNGSRYGG